MIILNIRIKIWFFIFIFNVFNLIRVKVDLFGKPIKLKEKKKIKTGSNIN